MIQLISFWSNFHDFLNQNLPNQVAPFELGLFIVSRNKKQTAHPPKKFWHAITTSELLYFRGAFFSTRPAKNSKSNPNSFGSSNFRTIQPKSPSLYGARELPYPKRPLPGKLTTGSWKSPRTEKETSLNHPPPFWGSKCWFFGGVIVFSARVGDSLAAKKWSRGKRLDPGILSTHTLRGPDPSWRSNSLKRSTTCSDVVGLSPTTIWVVGEISPPERFGWFKKGRVWWRVVSLGEACAARWTNAWRSVTVAVSCLRLGRCLWLQRNHLPFSSRDSWEKSPCSTRLSNLGTEFSLPFTLPAWPHHHYRTNGGLRRISMVGIGELKRVTVIPWMSASWHCPRGLKVEFFHGTWAKIHLQGSFFEMLGC